MSVSYNCADQHLANGLKKLGVTKDDHMAIYMPVIPEAANAMLTCIRIEVAHSIILLGYHPML